MPAKPRILVTGYNVRYPLGGHVAHSLNYLVGLQRLGCDVWYVEESGSWQGACYNPQTGTSSGDPSYGIAALKKLLGGFGLERQWVFVDEQRRYHNLSAEDTRLICRTSDLLMTISSVTWLPEFMECRRRVYIDTDPGVTQFQMRAEGTSSMSGFASPSDHHAHYTVGPNIGQADCPIPTRGLVWRPWSQPVVLDLFPCTWRPQAKYYTTVMNWAARKPMVFDGVEYGPKSQEFLRFVDLPRRVGRRFEIAVGGHAPPKELLRKDGWQLRDPLKVTRDWQSYRDYMAGSRGEFSAATNLVVQTRSGWFSDRSALYLAMGKQVLVQDTGAKRWLPAGEGFLPFQTVEDVAAALEKVEADYERHCRAARALAEKYFDAGKLLTRLLRETDVPVG